MIPLIRLIVPQSERWSKTAALVDSAFFARRINCFDCKPALSNPTGYDGARTAGDCPEMKT